MASEKPPRITISVSEFRKDMPEILHRVLLLNQEYVIEKHSQPYAILKRPPDTQPAAST